MRKEVFIDIILIFFLVFLCLLFYFVVGEQIQEEKLSKKTLKIATFEGLLSKELVKKFEDLYNVDVQFYYFDDEYFILDNLKNEVSYDLILVTDDLILELIDLNHLIKLDKRKVGSRFFISDFFSGKGYDENLEYSFPFDWGTTGIIFNKNLLNKKSSVDVFWNNNYKNKVALLKDSAEIVFILSLKNRIKDLPKTENERLILEKSLKDLEKNILGYFTSSEINEKINSGEIMASLQYSSDAIDIISKNNSLCFSEFKEGGIVWIESFAIPKSSKNREYAYKFIDFFIYPENNKKNFMEINAFSTNEETLKNMNSNYSCFNFFNYSYLNELNMFSEMPKSNEYYLLIEEIKNKFLEDKNGI